MITLEMALVSFTFFVFGFALSKCLEYWKILKIELHLKSKIVEMKKTKDELQLKSSIASRNSMLQESEKQDIGQLALQNVFGVGEVMGIHYTLGEILGARSKEKAGELLDFIEKEWETMKPKKHVKKQSNKSSNTKRARVPRKK